MKKAIILGIIASLFFAFTFVLNRQMNISGGNWLWSASLRYIFMLPILLLMMIIKNQLIVVLLDIVKKPVQWIGWSIIGFGFFYGPLCFASTYGASWLVAGTWQITIVAGALLSPLFFKTIKDESGVSRVRNPIPKKTILISSIILFGVFLMQLQESKEITVSKTIIGILPVVVAAFSYPLGNRKMMEVCDNRFSTIQRIFGMTLCSMPIWFTLAFLGFLSVGFPSKGQLIQSLIVAVCSGIIATVLFFKATDAVNPNTHKLAVIESTQSGEVVFTLLGGVFIFHDKSPTLMGLIGILLVIIGIILNSLTKA